LCALKGLAGSCDRFILFCLVSHVVAELFGEHAKHGILRGQAAMSGQIVASLAAATVVLLLRPNTQPGF
jgi:hypothetical protein